MTKQNANQAEAPLNEGDRIRARKRQVIDTLNDKFSQPVWRDRLLKICGGDESRIMKSLNSFITYIMNDDGGKADRKAYIADCSLASISTAFLEAFQMGIEVGGGRDHAYLVNYASQCELDISYKGFVYALNKHFDNAFVVANCVFEGDAFNCELTDNSATYTHKPKNAFEQNWEKMQGCYCYFSYTLKDGGGRVSRIIMIPRGKDSRTPDSLEMIKSKAKGSWAWKEFPFEQSKKATIRRAAKIPFASIDFGDEEINPEVVDNRHYQLEGSTSDRLLLMMEKHKEILQDEQKPDPRKSSKVAKAENIPPSQASTIGDQSSEIGERGKETSNPSESSTDISFTQFEGGDVYDASRYQDINDSDFSDMRFEGEIINQPVQETSKPLEQPAIDPNAWDGRTLIISGRPQQNDFPGALAAVNYLRRIMNSRKHKASRLEMINQNPKLIAALIKNGDQKAIDDLHKLAQQGV